MASAPALLRSPVMAGVSETTMTCTVPVVESPAASLALKVGAADLRVVSAGVQVNSPLAGLKDAPLGRSPGAIRKGRFCASTAVTTKRTSDPALAICAAGSFRRGVPGDRIASDVWAVPVGEVASIVTLSCRAPASACTSNCTLRAPVRGRIVAGTLRFSEVEEMENEACSCEPEGVK